jgi:Phage Tail Collar Domain
MAKNNNQSEKFRKIDIGTIATLIGTIVTLIGTIVGFAFWLGNLSSTVTSLKSGQDFNNLRSAALQGFAEDLETKRQQALAGLDDLPVGTILIWGSDQIPDLYKGHWMLCDGSEMPMAGNEELFNVIGNRWGNTPNGFRLPDLSSRFLRGADFRKDELPANPRLVGSTEGAAMPPHTHAKGTLRVAGGVIPSTVCFVFRLNPGEVVPGMNVRIYPDHAGAMDGNSGSAATLDMLGDTGDVNPVKQAVLDAQLRPINVATCFIIKVKR